MSLTALIARLARLEQRCPGAEPPYVPPELPEGHVAEVYRILDDLGYLESTLQSLGVPEAGIAQVRADLQAQRPIPAPRPLGGGRHEC